MADRCTSYARRVLAGDVPASEDVGLSCERHLRDLRDRTGGAHPELLWRPGRFERFERFCRQMIVVKDPQSGRYRPLELLDWQAYCFGQLLGWHVGEDDPWARIAGTRRFRRWFLLTGKGSGKTPGMAALALYHLRWDGELEPRIFVSAATMEQGHLVHEFCAASIERNAVLSRRLRVRPASKNAAVIERMEGAQAGVLSVLAFHFDGSGVAGQNPSMVLVDEYHEHSTGAMLDSLSKGIKSRRQPLIVVATNAGGSATGPWWELQEYGRRVNRGEIVNDAQLCTVFRIDPGDDPFEDAVPYRDRTCWHKANPGLAQEVPHLGYVIGEVEAARASADARRQCKRWTFGVAPDSLSDVWIEREAWERCEALDPPTDEELRTWDCWLGADLASIRDLCAVAALWRSPDGTRHHGRVWCFTCRDTLAERDHSSSGHLLDWAAEGWILLSDGAVLDYRVVAEHILRLMRDHNVRGMAYDRYEVSDLLEALESAGIRRAGGPGWEHPHLWCVDHPQGAKTVRLDGGGTGRRKDDDRMLGMPVAIARTERLMLGRDAKLSLEPNPVLRWAAGAATIHTTPGGRRVLRKEDSRARMKRYTDPVMALTMAIGLALCRKDTAMAAWLAANPSAADAAAVQ